jgi:lysophospholipase L1-like esterase
MDVRGQRVLVFGDSLTHRGSRVSPDGVDVTEPNSRTSASPGDLLASYLLEAGATSARINGRVSRSAVNFWKGNNGEAGAAVLAAEVVRRPSLVVILLGTNDLGMNAVADAEAFRLIRESFVANGARVVAVGPPSFISSELNQKAVTVYDTLTRVFGAANVVDWRRMTVDIVKPSQGRASDGVHFTALGARAAAARLAQAIHTQGAPVIATAGVTWLPPVIGLVLTGLLVGGAWLIRRRRTL